MSCRRVTIFGGTGFLGRRIVRHLQYADFAVRIASRHADRDRSLSSRDISGIEAFPADVNDDRSVGRAVSGACAVVNAVSLYVEREQHTFRSVHVRPSAKVLVPKGRLNGWAGRPNQELGGSSFQLVQQRLRLLQ